MSLWQRVQAAVPKPILFALYGLVGGVLAAGILAEPLFAALKPPPAKRIEPPALQISVSPSVTVYQGGEAVVPATILRYKHVDDVTLEVREPPAGVHVSQATIASTAGEVAIRLRADADAKPGTYVGRVAANCPSGTAQASFELTVRESPKPAPALRIAASPEVTVYTHASNKFSVRLVRDFFTGPVRLRAANLPRGATVPETTLPADRAETSIEMTVGEVEPGRYAFTLEGTGPGEVVGRTEIALVVKSKPRPAVDILFLLDVTGSMEFAIEGVSDGIQRFASQIQEADLDARVGLIAYRDRVFGQEPEILKFDGQTFTQDYEAFRAKVGRLFCVGNNTIPESTLDALVLGSRQEFRPKAAKVIVLITDAEPLVPDKETSTMSEAISHLREAGIGQIHTVVRRNEREIYGPLRRKPFTGEFFDLLDAVRRPGSFAASILPQVSAKIVETTVASLPAIKLDPAAPPKPPAETPAAPAKIAPPAEPPAPLQAVQATEQFDPTAATRLLLAVSAQTSGLALGIALALVAGQGLYLRQNLGTPLGLLAAGVGGAVAGLVGGAAAQALFNAFGGGDLLSRVGGWATLGALAGLGMTFFVPNFRRTLGLAGGTVGGALGALAFLALSSTLTGETGALAGRIIGGGLLGAALGLMLALAERAFRSAWLEVRYGRSETREVNLGPTPVSIGGDAQRATVYAFKAAPVACRVWLEDGAVIHEDVASGQRRVARPGESWTVGMVQVTLKTSAVARSGPDKLPPAPPPPPPPKVKTATTVAPSPASSVSRAQPIQPKAPPPPPAVKPPPPPPAKRK